MTEKAPGQKVADRSRISCETTIRRIRDRSILRLPPEASSKLPSRGQVAVDGVMNGHEFHTVLEPDGMRGHWLDIHEKASQALSVAEGDTVRLEIEPSKNWPEPDVPRDFQTALTGAPDISELWRGITPMARWEWVRWIGATKNRETRGRRVEVAVSKLRSGKRRPCCFDLAACTDPGLSKNGKLEA